MVCNPHLSPWKPGGQEQYLDVHRSTHNLQGTVCEPHNLGKRIKDKKVIDLCMGLTCQNKILNIHVPTVLVAEAPKYITVVKRGNTDYLLLSK